MRLISRILAPGVFGAEMEDGGQQVSLPPEEEVLVAKAGGKRRRDFALGRACARGALEQLGHRGIVIGKAEDGAPCWPAGVVGSITHAKGYAAALVGQASLFCGIGVDAERIGGITGGVTEELWPRLFDAAECRYLSSLDDAARSLAATLFFSAKESCYKAWAMKGALPFREIHITMERDGFTAARSGRILHGRFAAEGDLMLTAAWF
jgi:phosphopantetheine--protein transferase-like protein